MATIAEKGTPHDFIIWEQDERYSRDTVLFNNDTGAAASFEPGVAVIVSSGTATPAGIGEVATGILVSQIDDLADTASVKAVVLARHALVNGDQLNYNGDLASLKQTELLAVGIKAISQPTNEELLPA